MIQNQNNFYRYPDCMTLKEMASFLRISTKLASRLLREGVIPYRKTGNTYRVAKKNLVEYLTDRPTLHGANLCVESVTSNPKRWTSGEQCGIVCATKQKEVG